MDLENLIYQNDFCEVVSDKFVEHGVKRGHRVLVIGSKAFPVEESDPYTQRIKFLVHKLDGDHVFPVDIYIMDPISLAKVSKSEQERLTSVLTTDFPTEPTTVH